MEPFIASPKPCSLYPFYQAIECPPLKAGILACKAQKTYLSSPKFRRYDMKYDELVKKESAEMIEKFVADVLKQEPVEVHFNFEDDDQWALITMHLYDADQEISLRLHPDDLYDLHFGYYDDDDEFIESVRPLTEEEKKAVPERLRKVMKKVLADEQGMRLPKNFLLK